MNYYSQAGAAYVRVSDGVIRTAFKEAEFDDKIRNIMEGLK